jgi:hypothetical protein
MRDPRAVLMDTIGVLDYGAALLARAEHGPAREDVAAVRRMLKDEAGALLVLRARLTPSPGPDAKTVVG